MESNTDEKRAESAEVQEAPGGLTGAPAALTDAAAGKTVSDDGERAVLEYLLGATHRPEYTVMVELDTAGGLRELRFRLRAQDDRTMERIDGENRSGEGPFAKLDRSSFNASLVAEATVYIEDPSSGAKIEPGDKSFLGGAPSVPSALEARFRYQPGLLDGIAEQVRQISGYNPERVGTAQRVVAAATSN